MSYIEDVYVSIKVKLSKKEKWMDTLSTFSVTKQVF